MNEQLKQELLHILGNMKGGIITAHQAAELIDVLFKKHLSEHLTNAISRML
jgi:hypothetical protein